MRECLQRHPDEIAMRLQLAAVLSRQLRKSEAAEILRKGLEFTTDRGDIGQIELLLNLLKVEFDPPLPEDCLPALRRSLQKYPSQVGVRLAVARCLSALGRDMEANRILFDELTPFVHRNRDVWLAVFHRHVIAGNLKQADGMLRQVTGDERGRAARRADGDHRLQLARSMLHERLGENEQALALLQSADRSRSGSREVLVRQARLLQKVGRPSESAAAFERVHRIAKAELAIWHLLTTLGDRKPVSEECLSFAERLYESERPEQARAWRDLADRLVPGTGDSGAVRTDGAQQ